MSTAPPQSQSQSQSSANPTTEVIPETIKHFVRNLCRSLINNDVQAFSNLYEYEYKKLTEKLYKQSAWPSIQSLLDVFTNERDKELLWDGENDTYTPAGNVYRELYFRHIYRRMQPTLDDRFDAFQNYIDLFNVILGLDETNPELQFPVSYLYDIIHSFIDEFTEFHLYRNNVVDLDSDDISILRDTGIHLWSAQTVLRYLHAFIRKSLIDVKTATEQQKQEIHNQFKVLGQFAIIGLLRVNVLLCDYQSALNVTENITLPNERKGKRYTDAQRTALHFLAYISKNKELLVSPEEGKFQKGKKPRGEPRSHNLSQYSVDYLVNMVARLYGILAISSLILPDNIVYDDIHQNELRERFADRIQRLKQSIDPSIADDIFQSFAPEFLSVSPPNFNNDDNPNDALYTQQFQIFLDELKQRSSLNNLSEYLKLFTAVEVNKLAKFMNTNNDDVISELLKLKHKNRIIKHQAGSNNPVSGMWVDLNDVQFTIDNDTVYVQEHIQQRRYNDFWLKQTSKLQDVNRELGRLGNIRR